jgi:hypothetical protein
MRIEYWRFAFRRRLSSALATRGSITFGRKLAYALIIFSISFAVKSLHAVDLAPVMYTTDQPAAGMSAEYDIQARSILEGHGVLLPDQCDPSDTTPLEHPPGYSIYLSAIYRIFGRNYFRVQLIQNAINSISPVILFLIAGSLLGWRVGAASGVFAAVWHHLSYHSNLILPDSVCALPLLIGAYFLIKAERKRGTSFGLYVLAGMMIGLSVWFRPNAMFLGPFLAIVLIVVMPFRSKPLVLRRAAMVLAMAAVIAPITIRNYLIYREFVPVQVGMGLNLWTAIGQSGGERFGAVQYDHDVSGQEATLYDDPRYGLRWYTPDGIKRDRDRLRKSLDVIVRNPFWYAGSVLTRMRHMFNYSAEAALVSRGGDTRLIEVGDKDREAMRARLAQGHTLSPQEDPEIPAGSCLALGHAIFWLRPVVRAAQRMEKETALFFMFLGTMMAMFLSSRRSVLLMMVPAYYLLFQSMVHTEFRYTMPMHYFLFVFAALGWVLLFAVLRRAARFLYRRVATSWDKRETGASKAATEAGAS